ncbi:DUF3263 domain-containing protein [Nocardia australiensis]|uniref:DUF3263 domain-containing protein n=1 Tax=Nocardia australiensis TaxID=2887191 RepID=UPI001D15B36F|nr:DUF3263 domain-containing protein [Nocardia australiensis]
MTPDEHSMLEFATRWHRFDGGDEYIRPTFGITPPVFYQRLLWLLNTSTDHGLDQPTCRLVRQLCFASSPCTNPRTTSTQRDAEPTPPTSKSDCAQRYPPRHHEPDAPPPHPAHPCCWADARTRTNYSSRGSRLPVTATESAAAAPGTRGTVDY